MYACPKHVRTDHPVLVYKTCEIERTVLRLFSCLPPLLSLPAYTLHSQSSTLPISAYSSVTSTSSTSSSLHYYHNSSRSRQMDPSDWLTESISGSVLVNILIPQDRCLVSVFEDRHLSCRNWVITNAYVYAFIPVPAEDRGPSIM